MVKVLKIFSIITLILGLGTILIVKNISTQKKMYINQLEISLREESNQNQLIKLEWDSLISPINLQEIASEISEGTYTSIFVVLDKDSFSENLSSESYNDVINVAKPEKIINSPR